MGTLVDTRNAALIGVSSTLGISTGESKGKGNTKSLKTQLGAVPLRNDSAISSTGQAWAWVSMQVWGLGFRDLGFRV